jgi:DNA-binding NarL/FixJ family response regulator
MVKILIVDPNNPFRRMLKMILGSQFPLVAIRDAQDGKQGLELLQTFKPDLVFLEIHLPSDSGLDVARQVKRDRPDTIIILLTSYDSPEYRTAARQSGIEHLVPKDDWTGEDIIELVQTILAHLHINDQAFQGGFLPHEHSS